MNPIRLELTPEQLVALGSHTPGLRKALSPLAPGGSTDPEMDKQLIQAGLLDPNQRIKEPLGSLLSALGKTDVMVDVSWMNAGEPKGFSLYSPKTLDGSNPWGPTYISEAGSNGVVLLSPFTRQNLEVELQPVLEAGDASTPKLEIGLTAPQAVMLSVLMDEQRPQSSAAEPAKPAFMLKTWNPASVLSLLEGTRVPDQRQRYFSIPIIALLPALDWDPGKVLVVLNSLVQLGLCTLSNTDEYSLAEPMRNILAGFAGIGRLFWLSIRWSEGESDGLAETEAEHIGFCSSGMNLVFSWSNGNFRLKTLSRTDFTAVIAREIFPVTLSPVQQPAAPAVRVAAAQVNKKKVSTGLIVGLVGVLLVACVLMCVGMVFLLA